MIGLGSLISFAMSPLGRMLLVAAITLGGLQVSYWKGRSAGKQVCEARHEAARKAVEAELAIAKREWDIAQQRDEDEHNLAEKRNDALPSITGIDRNSCIGPDLLRRLQSVQ